jgi:histidinol-phosphate aminotransferase
MQRRTFVQSGLALSAAACAPALRGAPRAGAPVLRPIRLASNENPLGLSPAARQAALAALAEGNRYPREARQQLLEAVAAKHGVPADHVQLGAGSTEVLQMAVQALPAGAAVVVADPTYEDVPQYAATSGRRVVKVPLRADWSHDLDRMREAAEAAESALVFICNPNNPTGTLTPCDAVERWVREAGERTLLVVDEAYFEYVEEPGYRSMLPLIAGHPNVIVVRTFSKIHAMAGMRLGYALAQPATIRRLRAWACNNNANQLVLAAGRASLGDVAWHERSLASNRAARRILTECLDELGLDHLPSETNFVMHRVPGELGAYLQRMRQRGIWLGRPFPPLLGWNRVSIGLPEEMAEFAAELRGIVRGDGVG